MSPDTKAYPLTSFFVTATGRTVRYKDLECHGDTMSRIALAVTDNARTESSPTMQDGRLVGTSDDVATRIQLCPWFIDCEKPQYKSRVDQ